MSLQPQPAYPISDETRREPMPLFPKGAICLRLVEVLGQLYRDDQFAALFPTCGQPAASPARLTLVRFGRAMALDAKQIKQLMAQRAR